MNLNFAVNPEVGASACGAKSWIRQERSHSARERASYHASALETLRASPLLRWMYRFTRMGIVAWLLCLLILPAHAENPPLQEIKLGVLSFRSLEHTTEQWQPLGEYLTEKIPGYRFKIVPLFYPDLDAAVARHELDLVLTNPEHYVLLRSRHGLAAQATLMPLAGGYPVSQFGGVILARAERADLKSLADVKGKRVASPSEQSLGGYLMQRWALLQAGVDVTQDVRDLQFTGMPHDKVVHNVLASHADVGFVRTGVIEAMIKEGKLKPGQIKVLQQTPPPEFPQWVSTDLYPEWPFSAASGVPAWFSKQVVKALFDLEPNSEAARAGKYHGFGPAGDYSQIESIMVRLRVHPDHQLTLREVLERYSHWLLAGLLVLLVAAVALLLMRRVNRRLRLALDKAERLALRDTLLESLGEGVIGIDTQGQISFINATALDCLGFKREETLGRDLHAITHHHHPDGKTYDRQDCPVFATLAHGRSFVGEEWYFRKSGEGFPVSLTARPILDAAGGIQGVVTAFRDITREKNDLEELTRYRHHLEELVARRTAELVNAMTAAEAANQAKSAFLANMSHEIRTPMNAIVGLTHLLRQDITEPAQQLRLGKVADAARHLLGLLNDILDFSKIEAGKLTLEQTDFQLGRTLAGVASLMEEKIRDKGLVFHMQVEPDLDGSLQGDPTRLSQILLNYLSNAAKFTERGRIDLRAMLLAEEGEEVVVRFEVEDTGIGIPANRLSQLFQSFEQADSSTTRKYGGTGLGLAISRRLAEIMGGRAGAESRPGQGSTFWFTARLRRGGTAAALETSAPGPTPEHLLAALRGRRVLLVEDNLINQEVALDLLKEVGIRADLAVHGQEALDKINAGDYELVLMDVQMPVLDGLAATAALRRDPRHERLPILAMTASVLDEERKQCLSAGMNDLVAKPVDPEQLYATLARWLPERRKRELAPMATETRGEDPELHAALAGIPGLDLAAGLRRVRGRIHSYARLLGKFAEGHGEDMQQLRDSYAVGDRESALRIAHSLKGSAGTLGVPAIQAMAEVLEGALRAADPESRDLGPLERHLAELDREWACFAQAIRAALPAAAPAPAPAVSRVEAIQALARLEGLLAGDDMAAVGCLQASQDLLASLLPAETLARLRRQIEGYDFHHALDTLRDSGVQR